jgi:hypothetical protein
MEVPQKTKIEQPDLYSFGYVPRVVLLDHMIVHKIFSSITDFLYIVY